MKDIRVQEVQGDEVIELKEPVTVAHLSGIRQVIGSRRRFSTGIHDEYSSQGGQASLAQC